MNNLVDHIKANTATRLDEGIGQNIAAGILAAGLVAGNPSVALAQKPVDNRVQLTNAEMDIDREKLLRAIKKVESSDGVDKRDRYEAGVEKQLRKRLQQLHKNTREAIQKYGFKRVATSYGPWQILASTAYDLGFKGAPEDLRDEKVSKPLVEDLIHNIIFSKRTSKLEDVVSAYNAGLGGIGKNPGYVNKVLGHYGKI
mgnify:CR=1 FL=1|jgi:hypothetical protein